MALSGQGALGVRVAVKVDPARALAG